MQKFKRWILLLKFIPKLPYTKSSFTDIGVMEQDNRIIC